MKRLYFLLSAILFVLNAQAQTLEPFVVNASGGYIQNSIVNVEWSLGELAITTIGNSNNLLTQGFLQPLLGPVSGTSNEFTDAEIIAFPNPVSSHLSFKTSLQDIATIQILDVLGREVLKTAFTKDLDLHQLVGGMYLIVLFDKKQQLIQTFKIIKN